MNKYKEALNRMEEAYYSSDNSMGAMNLFKEDINLLTGLVNEHFKDEIIQHVKYVLAVVNGELKICADTNCDECDFKCSCCGEKRFEWLASPYKKLPYKLSQWEYDLLNAYKNSVFQITVLCLKCMEKDILKALIQVPRFVKS
jgi:hypothetical protein